MTKTANLMTPLILIAMLAGGFFMVMAKAKAPADDPEPEAQTLDTDRYEVLDAFRMPTSIDSYAGDKGMIIKDRTVPDTCFLYVKAGGHNGNIALQRTPCEK